VKHAIIYPPDDFGFEVPPLAITNSGDPKPTHANVSLLLAALPGQIRFESFAQRITCSGLRELGYFPDGEWTDQHTTQFVQLCERHGLGASPAIVDRAVTLHAHRNAYNVLADFVGDCAAQWDGVARVDQAFTTYWRAEDTAATRAAARVFLLSLARRALDPGAKVDTVPVFKGDQGVRKSTGLETLVGPAWFADSPLPIGDKDGMQALPGTWLWEFGENHALSRRDLNAVKAFLSQRVDKYRPSYGRHNVSVPRQTCFAITTNEQQTLNDSTGARRFLPVVVGAVDTSAIERDRTQLIGEAARRLLDGEEHWPSDAETAELAGVRELHRETDPWEEPIAVWLETRSEPFELTDLFECESHADRSKVAGPVPLPLSRVGKKEQGRAAAVLRGLGWVRKQSRARGPHRGKWLWCPP